MRNIRDWYRACTQLNRWPVHILKFVFFSKMFFLAEYLFGLRSYGGRCDELALDCCAGDFGGVSQVWHQELQRT
jgi:hypothetical protein